MTILNLGFPISIWTFVLGTLVGLGITLLTFGVISFVIFIILIYTGVIRISPILDIIYKGIQLYFPNAEKETIESIQRSFQIKQLHTSTLVNKGIYCFHPHGSFSVSYFFHTMTNLTEFPIKGKSTVARALYWLPWGNEILDGLNAVPNTYGCMKKVLENKENLFIIPGGVKEMYLYNSSNSSKNLTIWIKERKGLFRLALETKTPLVPVLSYGEEQIHELANFPGFSLLQRLCKKVGLGLPLPSWKTLINWISVTKGGTKTPVYTVIGSPVQLPGIIPGSLEISEKNIETYRNKYIHALQDLFEKTKLPGYTLTVM
jgi:hypothetical protein